MATTVTRSNYWMLKLTSNTPSTYNFKFVVDIWVDGAKFIRLKQPKNNNDSAHINFEKIVKNYIKVNNKHDNTITSSVYTNQYDSIHLIPLNKTSLGDYPLSKNTDTLKTFTFEFFEEYSTTANGTVSVTGSTTADDEIYPLINYANEWEDKMEFDEDKFSLKDKIVGQMTDPSFTLGTADWAVVLNATIAHSSGNMIVTANTGTSETKIYTPSIPISEGKEYILRYGISSSTNITAWKYWNGRQYITAPSSSGTHYIKFTATRNYLFFINVFGLNHEVNYDYINLFEVKEESSFLTNLPAYTTKGNSTSGLIPQLTSFNDYRTFSFINTDEDGFDTKDGIIEYKFFNEAPVFETQIGGGGAEYQVPTNYIARIDVDNDSANGSELPADSNSDGERLVFAGVGCGNVKNLYYADRGGFRLDEKNETQMGVKYYTVTYSSGTRLYSSAKSVDKIKRGDRCYINVLGNTQWHSFVTETNPVSEINSTNQCYIAFLGDTNWQNFGAPVGAAVGTVFTSTSSSVTGTGKVVIKKRSYYIKSSNVTGTGIVERWYGTPSSKTYLFEIASDLNCNSTRFDEYSLAWKNKYGTWDYYMFDGEHSDVRNYNRQDQSQKVAGSWGASDFAIESYERGKVQKVGGTKQTTINTRFITDDYNDYFNGLLMSNEVLLLPKINSDYSNVYDAAIPINIKDTSLAYKTNLKDKLVQYSFTFEYAHNLKQRV